MTIHDPRASFFRKPWVRVRNTTSETIAPYSVMRIVGATEHRGEIVYTVAKPNATSYDWYLVNGPLAIPPLGTLSRPEGMGTFLTTGGYVRYTGATPTLGETWGPSSGAWEISTGNSGFYITGGVESVAGNTVVTAVQNPAGSGSAHAMGLLTGGTLAATDMSAPATTILDATMQSQTGDVYLPADDGTWSLAEEDATLFNPSPFRHEISSPLYLEKYNGLWLVAGAHEWKPVYRTSFDGSHATPSGGYVTFDGGSFTPVSKGNIASEAGDTITIEAPVRTNAFYWEVECGGSVLVGGTSAGDAGINVALHKNGASSPPQTTGATCAGMSTTASLGVYEATIPFHFRSVVELEQGDTLKVYLTATAGGTVTCSVTFSILSIKPLF